MKTLEDLIVKLQEFPKDALWSAYEGEDCGINIVVGKDVHFISDGERERYCRHVDAIK